MILTFRIIAHISEQVLATHSIPRSFEKGPEFCFRDLLALECDPSTGGVWKIESSAVGEREEAWICEQAQAAGTSVGGGWRMIDPRQRV